jgi:outer membrane biosynthesis protein TonB
VTDLFNRLGSIGVLLIAGALIVGGLTGAAVAHHYETLSSVPAASQQQQGDNTDIEKGSNAQQAEKSEKPDAKPAAKHNVKPKPAPKKAKPKPSASPSPKPSGSPEPDQVIG